MSEGPNQDSRVIKRLVSQRLFASYLLQKSLAKLLRFTGVGVFSGLFYAAVTTLSVSAAGISATTASMIGYAAVIPLNFVLQRTYTFRSGGLFTSDVAKYVVVQVANLVLCAAAMTAVVELFGLHYFFGIVAAVLIVPLVTYFVMDRWVFSRQSGH